MFIGRKLKELREERGMLQEDVGKLIGVNKQAVSFYELGKRQPSRDKVMKFCEFFNVKEGFFYNEEEDKDIVRELIDSLVDEGIISDPDHISDNVAKMIIDAVKMDLRKKQAKEELKKLKKQS